MMSPTPLAPSTRWRSWFGHTLDDMAEIRSGSIRSLRRLDGVDIARYARAVERRVMPTVRRRLAPRLAKQVNLRLFEDRAFGMTSWLGVPIWKEPADLWTYQHIIHETRPDLIIETGTLFGGSAFYFATLCDLIDNGTVMSVDIQHLAEDLPQHPRVEYVLGSSIAPEVVGRIKLAAQAAGAVLVILDSDHRYSHVIQELRTYGQLVTPGSYMIVEDTMFDFTASTDFGRGPAAAVAEYLGESSQFEVDRSRERYLVTQNPGGYLRRVEPRSEYSGDS